jgi:hypothetical protein
MQLFIDLGVIFVVSLSLYVAARLTLNLLLSWRRTRRFRASHDEQYLSDEWMRERIRGRRQ